MPAQPSSDQFGVGREEVGCRGGDCGRRAQFEGLEIRQLLVDEIGAAGLKNQLFYGDHVTPYCIAGAA